MVDCMGDNGMMHSRKKVASPSPNHICYEIPLPEICPIGFTGLKCDRCADGFVGPNCTTCAADHYGRHCTPCVCFHGTCEVVDWESEGEPSNSLVVCQCDRDYYGPTCSTYIQTGPNLINDTNFATLQRKDTSPTAWKSYGDCVTFENDELWLSNTGKKICMVDLFLQLNQEKHNVVVLSAESKADDIVDLANAPNWYSLYVDTTFQDDTKLWGSYVAFSPGSHEWEYRNIIFSHPKPVKTLHIILFLKFYSGRAAYRNVLVKESTRPSFIT